MRLLFTIMLFCLFLTSSGQVKVDASDDNVTFIIGQSKEGQKYILFSTDEHIEYVPFGIVNGKMIVTSPYHVNLDTAKRCIIIRNTKTRKVYSFLFARKKFHFDHLTVQ